MSAELARVGGPLAVAGLALVVLARPRGARLLGLASWVLGCALLVPLLAPSGETGPLVGAALAGLAIAVVLAACFRRWPWSLPLLALAMTPARIPVSIGDTEANLLVPLYAIVAGAAVLLVWELLRGDSRARELGPLAWPFAILLGWLGLSTVWSDDLREAAIEVLFFLAPFGLLAAALARLPWRERGIARLWQLLAGMGLLFAAFGIGQWLAKDVFWNPKVIVGNQVEPFFRVNSLFWDPSIYGRFLVVAILATLVVLLLPLSLARRWSAPLVAGIAVTWVGLLFSYSQSSFAALVAGILVLSAVGWRARAFAAAALAAAALVSLGARAEISLAQGDGLRGELVENGIEIALDHPLLGVGLGGFKEAYVERLDLRPRAERSAASHTTPVTVAAETGFVGLLLFAWFLAAAAWAAFRRAAAGAAFPRAAAWAAGLTVVAVAVHSCFYNAFFEDPMVWGALGILAVVVQARRQEMEGSRW